jgi:hypothetical protein
MANIFYSKAKEAFVNANINWLSNTIKVVLVDLADYTPNFTTDEFLSDVPVAARVATSPALASKTNVGGVMDAADVTFTLVTGDQSEALLIFVDTGVASTSRLISYFDVVTGLPVLPNGGDINVVWSNGASKIQAI